MTGSTRGRVLEHSGRCHSRIRVLFTYSISVLQVSSGGEGSDAVRAMWSIGSVGDRDVAVRGRSPIHGGRRAQRPAGARHLPRLAAALLRRAPPGGEVRRAAVRPGPPTAAGSRDRRRPGSTPRAHDVAIHGQ